MAEYDKPEVAQLESAREPPSAQNGYHVDAATEKRLVRKLDRKLIPLVMLLCKQLVRCPPTVLN